MHNETSVMDNILNTQAHTYTHAHAYTYIYTCLHDGPLMERGGCFLYIAKFSNPP